MSLSSQSEPAQANPENKCPDCLTMELIMVKPVESRQGLLQRLLERQSVTEAIDLKLNLNFSDQREELP